LADKQVVTDESSAIESFGLQPKLVEGDWCNIKITRPADLERVMLCE
jgi:2-C-methyl-D-erythritol 4-phosphate cytidylyltransferase